MDPQTAYRNLILYPHIGFGKSQPLTSEVFISENQKKFLSDIVPGDKVLSPDGTQTEVLATVDWPEEDIYELEMENGSTMRCGLHHLHHVSYRVDDSGEPIWEDVETSFLLDHPDLDFMFALLDTTI